LYDVCRTSAIVRQTSYNVEEYPMAPLKTLPLPQSSQHPARGRRVKRGIVAGYLHELTQRHSVVAPKPSRAVAVQPER
jgi:hypothetical protein